LNKSLRNPFIALSELASKKRWCWKIPCTTCGAIYFRKGFRKIDMGIHPDTEEWQRSIKISNPLDVPLSTQRTMCKYLSNVSIKELNEVSSFPDWLGHIGLVIYFSGIFAHKPGEHLKNEFLKIIDQNSYAYNEIKSLNIIEFHHLNQFESDIHQGICNTIDCNHRSIF